MRKKYLSALLFGALLFASAGTFTSCKDYDDDIDNLQQQIDGLATKEDMQAKLDQMQTAVDDAKATAEEALEKANAAGDADKIAELEGRIAELEKTLGDIDAMKKEIQDALDSQIADFREEMEELLAQVEELTGYSLGMVTSIGFEVKDVNNEAAFDSKLDVNYARVKTVSFPTDLKYNNNDVDDDRKTADSYVFGEGMTGAFTIKEGDVNTVTDYMLVNINPANAAISNDMLSLVNGEGVNLNEYVNVTSTPWSGQISRATQATGLRMVGVQLKSNLSSDEFDKLDKLVLPNDAHHATTAADCEHGYIGYALAVTDAEKDRSVTSSYDVTLHVQEETMAVKLNQYSTISSNAASIEDRNTPFYEWAKGEDAVGTKENCYPVENGVAFDINMKSAYNATNPDEKEGGRLMASYVVVDYNEASLSNTDKAALKGLTFEGVNTVVKGEDLHHAITVNGTAGIPVPLKIVTIDYTGYIRVIKVWVKAGEAVTVNAAYTVTPKEYVSDVNAVAFECKGDKQAFTIPANAASYSIEMTVGETAHAGETNHAPVVFDTEKNLAISYTALNADNSAAFLKLYKADKESTPGELAEVAYAEFVGKVNLQMMREDKAYEGVVKFYDNTGTYLGANSIQVTKKLPTAVPADFSAKTNTIVNGVMTIYPEPISGQTKGEYDLTQAFNGWGDAYYTLDIDGITNTTNPDKGDYNATDKKITNIIKDVINDQKTYDAAIGYNYGKIKYVPEGHGVDETAYEHIVPWTTAFAFQFNDWVVDCEYQWSETPVVYYRKNQSKDQIIMGKVTKDDKGKVTAFENVIKARTPYNSIVDPFDADDADWTTWADALNAAGDNANVEITLITNNDGKEVENEFFTATFVIVNSDGNEVTSGTTGAKNAIKLQRTGAEVKVGADIETKVVLKIKDKFGHTHKVPAEGLTFTMKINEE